MKRKKYSLYALFANIVSLLLAAFVHGFQADIILGLGIRAFRVFQVVSNSLLCLSLGILLILLGRWIISARRSAQANRREVASSIATKADPVAALVKAIDNYIATDKSTPFFLKNLGIIRQKLVELDDQVKSVETMTAHRVGTQGMSYGYFVGPVKQLLTNLVKLGNDLIQRLLLFDERKYQAKIDELTTSNSNESDNAEDYVTILNGYKDYTLEIVKSFETTALKLDRIVLEIGRMDDEELARYLESIKELDRVIGSIKLFKTPETPSISFSSRGK